MAEDTLQASDTDPKAEPDTEVVTDHKATVKERVETTKFESPAGTFFQNNRSILPSLLGYVREQIVSSNGSDEERYLVDAYCGSGLFSLCLASLFKEVSGVEISAESIKYAEKNAELNGIANAKFLAGNAEDIFAVSPFPRNALKFFYSADDALAWQKIAYPSDKTTVIIE